MAKTRKTKPRKARPKTEVKPEIKREEPPAYPAFRKQDIKLPAGRW